MKQKVGLHLFDSPIVTESRLLKLSQSLVEIGAVDRVIVAGVWRPELPATEPIDANRLIVRARLLNDRAWVRRVRERFPILGKVATLASLLQRWSGLILLSFRYRPRLICCHNLALLPVACLAKWLSGGALLYVPHELETERTGIRYPAVAKRVERLCIRHADHTIVVSPLIKVWYEATYATGRVASIRNVPLNPFLGRKLVRSYRLREGLGVSPNGLLFIYQGLIDRYRGVDFLLAEFARVSRHHIVFMGFGDGVETVRDYAGRHENIHYHEAVAMDRIIETSSGADVGLLFVPETWSLSYRYTTANKIFEYAIAELPVLISANFEYMSAVVQEHRIGWVVAPNRDEFAAFLDRVTPRDVESMRENVRAYGRTIDWRSEAAVLGEILGP